jgi:hypothetical protein
MALFTNINFTDPQGVDFTAATFGVSYASRYSNNDERLNRDMTDMETMNEVDNARQNINVQYYYWPSEDLRLAGNSPYILANMNDGTQPPTMSFDFLSTASEYIGMTLEQACEHYLMTYILV